MEKDVFLIFLVTIFGFFILLAVNIYYDKPILENNNEILYKEINEPDIGDQKNKDDTFTSKIIELKKEDEKKDGEEAEILEEEKEEIKIVEKIVYVPEIVEVPVYTHPPIQEPIASSETIEEPIIINENIMEYTLEIISPLAGKGLGREYLSRDKVKDEYNYLVIALIVWENGEAKRDSNVKVVATDSSQNKEINGTGDMAIIYKDGNKKVMPAYFFDYEFKESGNHTITFFAEGKEITTETLEVAVDARE